MLEIDSNNRDHITRLREELRPTVTFSEMPRRKYVELFSVHWSAEGGNVILAVPMGEEALRSEKESPAASSAQAVTQKIFRFRFAPSSTRISAPNGSAVAIVEVEETDTTLALTKGQSADLDVGAVKVEIEPRTLISGSQFIAAPSRLVCYPSVDGASPRTWEYTVFCRFDGFTFSVELRQLSTSLRNKNLPSPLNQLGDGEELLMTIPKGTLHLSSTLDAPAASSRLVGHFLLRDTN